MIAKQIRELDEVDKELIRLKLEVPGRSLVDLAELVGFEWKAVGKRMAHPMVKRTIYEYQKKAIDLVKEAKEKAARRLIKLIDSEHEPTAAKVCLALLADVLPAAKVDHNVQMELSDHRTLLLEKLNHSLNGKVPQPSEN